MKTKPTPGIVDTTVPEKMTHKFCRCQWPEGPGIATSICGKTLPIEGRPVNPHDNRCPECLEIKGMFLCPICVRRLWAG
jgi:hypothetical protein